MPPNSKVNFLLQLTIDSPLPNGTIIYNDNYSALATNALTVTGSPVVSTIVRAPEFSPLQKTVTPTTVIPGELLTYTLILSNSGDYRATNVIITDTLPNFPALLAPFPPPPPPAML